MFFQPSLVVGSEQDISARDCRGALVGDANPAVVQSPLAGRRVDSNGTPGKLHLSMFDFPGILSPLRCRCLANETAFLVCGMYVDLNQIRAGEALTPETSSHTSAFERIGAARQRAAAGEAQGGDDKTSDLPDGWLCELTLQDGPEVNVAELAGSGNCRRASNKGLF